MDKIRNAAIIIFGVGEKCAAEILKNMSPKDVKAIIEEINKIDVVSEQDVMRALNEFFIDSKTNVTMDSSSKTLLKNSLLTVIDNGGINSVIDELDKEKNQWIDAIRMETTQNVLDLIIDEHPQIITSILLIIFNRVSANKGSALVKELPEPIKKDVFKRMTTLGSLSIYAIDTLAKYFNEQLSTNQTSQVVKVNGLETVASMMSLLDTETEHEILSHLNADNNEIKEKIEDKMFTFQRLTDLDKKSLQLLMAEVKNEDLALALKGVDENVRTLFMKNMSSKSADILKDDMEALGPVKLVKVLDAQKSIIKLAKQLGAEEKIILTSRNDPNFIF